ncbi:hypothetical protein Bpfe_012832, partial [Biomphalaria pfeifferi]
GKNEQFSRRLGGREGLRWKMCLSKRGGGLVRRKQRNNNEWCTPLECQASK